MVKDFAVGALKVSTTGSVSPYKLTVAYAENAKQNGVSVYLNTAVLSMEHTDGEITKVITNRGSVSAKCVINCAGVFADKIAEMAGDRYFSIHPRKGVDLLMDPKGNGLPPNAISLAPTLKPVKQNKNTKGGGTHNISFPNKPGAIDSRPLQTHPRRRTFALPRCIIVQKIGRRSSCRFR